MGKDWPYSQLSEEAKAMGGADKVLEILRNLDILKQNEYDKGASDRTEELAPWFAVATLVATGVGVAGTLIVEKLCKRYNEKKEERRIADQRAAEAEAKLISAIIDDAESDEEGLETSDKNLT